MKQACGYHSEDETSLPIIVVAGVASECMLHYYKKHVLKNTEFIQKEQNCQEALEELRQLHGMNKLKPLATRFASL